MSGYILLHDKSVGTLDRVGKSRNHERAQNSSPMHAQGPQGPHPTWHVYSAGKRGPSDGQSVGSWLNDLNANVMAAKRATVRNTRRSKWTEGTVYARVYDQSVCERKKTTRERLVEFNSRHDDEDDDQAEDEDYLASIPMHDDEC